MAPPPPVTLLVAFVVLAHLGCSAGGGREDGGVDASTDADVDRELPDGSRPDADQDAADVAPVDADTTPADADTVRRDGDVRDYRRDDRALSATPFQALSVVPVVRAYVTRAGVGFGALAAQDGQSGQTLRPVNDVFGASEYTTAYAVRTRHR